jgi:hypothetical protein
MAGTFAITKDEVSRSLFAVTETWFDNYRALIGKVEQDALNGQPEKVAIVSALSFIKDTSGLAKDHMPVESVKAFIGSPQFAISLFVIGVAAHAYDAHWKNLEARANCEKGAVYTTIFVNYLQKLTDIESRITSFPWYQSILDQAYGYLSKCEFSSPSDKNDGHIRTLINLFLINLGIVPKAKDLYNKMQNSFGRTIKNAKAIFECSYHQPLRQSYPPSSHSAIAFSAKENAVPAGALNKIQNEGLGFWRKYRKMSWQIVKSDCHNISKDDKQFQDSVLALSGLAEVKVIDYMISASFGTGYNTYKMKMCWVWKRQGPTSIAVNQKSMPSQISDSKFRTALNSAAEELNKKFGYEIAIKSNP